MKNLTGNHVMNGIRITIFLTLFTFASAILAEEDFSYYFEKGEMAADETDYENAIRYFQEAILHFDSQKDSTGLGDCFLNLGRIYGILGEYPKSAKYAGKASDIFMKTGNDRKLIDAYLIQGNLANLENDYREALRIYNTCLAIADSLQMNDTRISLHNNIGVLNYNLGNYPAAISSYTIALEIARKNNSLYGTSLSLVNTGISLRELNDHQRAIENIKEGIEIAHQINDLYILSIGYEQLALVYTDINDYANAYKALNQYLDFNDSLNSLEINKKIQEQEVKYQTQSKELEILRLKAEKQQNEIANLEQDKKIESLSYLLGVAGFVLVLILITSILFFRQYKNKLALSEKLKQSKSELEKKNQDLENSLETNKELQSALRQDLDTYKQLAYRKQINPHFIFNSLNTVQNYILSNNKIDSNYFLGELSTLIRRVLENSEKDLITLDEELFVCNTYIKLEQKRFQYKFNYSFEKSDHIDGSTLMIPPMLLQPFIENAIWHGLLHKENDAKLIVDLNRSEGTDVVISIIDNGIGRSQSLKNQNHVNGKSESMGIQLTEKRIKVNNFLQKNQISMHINDLVDNAGDPCGTEVVIVIQQT
ncbi:MAG: tetratricopeptide repeat protein [Bacteroidales bacterium]|nr:tetratricopeptide repeat protein [Bacteroidales bacterium]